MKKKGGDDEEEKLQQTKALALKRISIYQRVIFAMILPLFHLFECHIPLVKM